MKEERKKLERLTTRTQLTEAVVVKGPVDDDHKRCIGMFVDTNVVASCSFFFPLLPPPSLTPFFSVLSLVPSFYLLPSTLCLSHTTYVVLWFFYVVVVYHCDSNLLGLTNPFSTLRTPKDKVHLLQLFNNGGMCEEDY